MALIAKLCDDIVFTRDLLQIANLSDAMRQRLLAVDVFAALHCRLGNYRVRVIGRSNHHGVQLLVVDIEHFTEIAIFLGLRKVGQRFCGSIEIDVTHGDHVFVLQCV